MSYTLHFEKAAVHNKHLILKTEHLQKLKADWPDLNLCTELKLPLSEYAYYSDTVSGSLELLIPKMIVQNFELTPKPILDIDIPAYC